MCFIRNVYAFLKFNLFKYFARWCNQQNKETSERNENVVEGSFSHKTAKVSIMCYKNMRKLKKLKKRVWCFNTWKNNMACTVFLSTVQTTFLRLGMWDFVNARQKYGTKHRAIFKNIGYLVGISAHSPIPILFVFHYTKCYVPGNKVFTSDPFEYLVSAFILTIPVTCQAVNNPR